MKGLFTVDLLQILRLQKNGLLKKSGNYQLGIISSAIIDLINLDRLEFKLRNEDDIYLLAKKDEIVGNELLDEIYLTIRDCPKEYNIQEWLDRFLDCYSIYEKIHMESLVRREILVDEMKIRKISRYLVMFLIILAFPFSLLAIAYYNNLMKPRHLHLKNPNFQTQLTKDLYDNLRTFDIPEPSMYGLIIILKILSLNPVLLGEEFNDYVTKKYYQLQDNDFGNADLKLFVKYLTKK
ncbi:MAG: hypothetical protein ACFFDW_04345 [Candidatus Thorarchaeota archaeon]